MDVGRIGGQRRQAENTAKSDRKDEKPDKRAHQRRQKTATLMQETQRLAPDDAASADHPPLHVAAPSGSWPVRSRKASESVPSPAISLAGPASRISPRCMM